MKRDYKHTEEFYKERYIDLTKWASKNKVNLKDFGINSWKSFKSFYLEINKDTTIKNKTRALKYALKGYKTNYNTAIAELQALKETFSGDEVALKSVKLIDLKTMTTQDFFNKYKTEIMKTLEDELVPYTSKTGSTTYGTAGAIFIAQNWFGSE